MFNKLISKLQSPVVISAILVGAIGVVKAIQLLPQPKWDNVSLIILGYIYAIFVAINNPENKDGI